jgi:hypothetical protein
MSDSDERSEQAASRARLAAELAREIDEVLFNLEHGIPESSIRRLAALAAELERLGASSGPGELAAETAAFRAAVGGLFRDAAAPEEVIARGQRILSLLEGRER